MIPKNENEAEGMVAILDQLSEYVPVVQGQSLSGEAVPEEQPVPEWYSERRDHMLTAARVRTAQDVRVTSSGKKALRGLISPC